MATRWSWYRGFSPQDAHRERLDGQAVREVRVMVRPDSVDDVQPQGIALDIAKQVEGELAYPGQIRITVVRESCATEFARCRRCRLGRSVGGAGEHGR
jgi:HD superfamily phosphodiesterase